MNLLDFVFTHYRKLGYYAWRKYDYYGLGEHFDVYSANRVKIIVTWHFDFLWFYDDQNNCVLLKTDPFSTNFLDEINKFAIHRRLVREPKPSTNEYSRFRFHSS